MDPNNLSFNTNNNIFDYESASKAITDLTLDTFFNFNSLPTVREYPNIETFKHGFIAMNDKIYREAKKSHEKTKQLQSEEDNSSCPLKKNHHIILENKKIPKYLKNKIRRSAMKYCHSQALIRLLHGYYSLMDYHHKACKTYPDLFKQYLKTILTIFGSIEKDKLFIIFKEVCLNERMSQFYTDLYTEWMNIVNSKEKEVLLAVKL